MVNYQMSRALKLGKRIFMLTTIFVIICSLSLTVFAAPSAYQVSVPRVKQEKTNWCWAACSVSCISYAKGSAPSQTSFVTTVKGSAVNEPATLGEIVYGLGKYGTSCTSSYSYVSFSTLKAEMYQYDSPFIVGWSWSSGGGHALVLYGYTDYTNPYVRYLDPWDGSFNYVSYNYFKGGSSYDHTWFGTVRKIM